MTISCFSASRKKAGQVVLYRGQRDFLHTGLPNCASHDCASDLATIAITSARKCTLRPRSPAPAAPVPVRVECAVGPGLDRQDEAKPIINFGEQSRVESSDSFCKKRLVHSDDLRNIYDGRFRKPGSLGRKANVSRSVGQAQVRCNDGRDNCADAAVIEAICRNDQQRPSQARARSGGLWQRSPPNLAAAHYRLPRVSVRC